MSTQAAPRPRRARADDRPAPARDRRGTAARPGHRPVSRRGLLVAVACVAVGSVTPWVDTPFGNLSGIAGGGLWTLYAAAIGLAGTVWRRPRIAAVHAAVMAVPALVLPAWQIGRLLPLGGFGQGWMPGFGLVAVVGGGVLAARSAVRLARG